MRSACADPGRRAAALAALALLSCGEPADRAEPGAGRSDPAPRSEPSPPDPDRAALPGEISFIVERGGRAEIHAIRPDGTGRRVVASAPDASFYPAPGSGAAWLLAIRSSEIGGHREELTALEPGGAARALLAAGRVRNPSAAPAGWVAVESDASGFRDLYRIDAGGTIVRLTENREGNFEPAVSPDGARIAFTSSRDGNAEIYVMAADGSAETRLTAFHRDDWSPVWSPSGDAIAFLSAREGPARLFVMLPDGTGQRRLLADWDAEVEEESPVFSPDGSSLAVVVRRKDGGGEIWLADPKSGARRPLSQAGARDSAPVWSPDGRYLVFASDVGEQSDLTIARVDRSAPPRRLTEDPAPEWLPRWTRPR
jgi:TolB protein